MSCLGVRYNGHFESTTWAPQVRGTMLIHTKGELLVAAHSGGWNGIAQLPMLSQVAIGTQHLEILERIMT